MVVDAHVHLYTGTPEKKYFPTRQTWHICMRWAHQSAPYDRDPAALYPRQEPRMSDPDGTYTIGNMDDQGVEAAVCLPVDYDLTFGEESPLSIEEKHQHLGELQRRYPGRIIAMAGPDPRRTNSLEIFKRGIREHGLQGLKMAPSMGYFPWDPRVSPIYEFCLDNDLPVLSCTQFNSGGGYRYARFSQPLQLNDVLCDFPDLKMVLLHAGHAKLDWFEESILVAMNNPNVYIQIDVWVQGTGIPRDPRTSLFPLNAFNAEETIVTMLARAKYALGAHRILFGTDTESGPAFQGDNSVRGFGYKNLIDWWRKLPQTAAKYGFSFTDEEIGMILDTNAKRLFKLEATPPDLEVRGKYGFRYRYPSPNRG